MDLKVRERKKINRKHKKLEMIGLDRKNLKKELEEDLEKQVRQLQKHLGQQLQSYKILIIEDQKEKKEKNLLKKRLKRQVEIGKEIANQIYQNLIELKK